MKKSRIMHVLNSNSFSGAENVAITIINETNDFADSVYVSPNGTIKEVLSENHINYIPLKRMNVMYLKKAVQAFNPSIIHAHDFTASIFSSFMPKNIVIISHIHNNPPWIKRFSKKTLLFAISAIRYKKILSVSQAFFEEYIFHNIIKSKGYVIQNPINTERIRTMSAHYNPNKEFDLIFLGRLTLQKNPLLFIEIVKKLSKKYPKLKVAIVGNGDLRENVEYALKDYDLENNCTMFGFLDNPYAILKNSKILCITSSWEGYGLVAVEALALGVPVVSTSVGGLKTIINDECGYLCKNIDEFCNSITELLSNKQLYDEKKEYTRRRLDELPTLKTYMKNIEFIYKSVYE